MHLIKLQITSATILSVQSFYIAAPHKKEVKYNGIEKWVIWPQKQLHTDRPGPGGLRSDWALIRLGLRLRPVTFSNYTLSVCLMVKLYIEALLLLSKFLPKIPYSTNNVLTNANMLLRVFFVYFENCFNGNIFMCILLWVVIVIHLNNNNTLFRPEERFIVTYFH